MRAGRVGFRRLVDPPLLVLFQPQQRGSEAARIAGDLGADAVGLVFAGAADGHLHDHRRDGREDDQQDRADRAEGVVPLVAAPEHHPELRQHPDRARQRCRDGHDERVAVLDMRQFMRDHAGNLALAHHVEQAGIHRDRPFLRVATGGEGVGLVLMDHIERGHRKAGARCEGSRHLVKPRRILRPDGLGVVHPQHHAVAVPPGEDIHPAGEEESEDHPLLAGDGEADRGEQRRQPREQKRCTDIAGHGLTLPNACPARWTHDMMPGDTR